MALLKSCITLRNILLPYTKQMLIYSDKRSIARWVSPTLRELKRRRDRIGPEPERPRSSYLDWNYAAELHAFGPRLNEHFDSDLLQTALTNRSYKTLRSDDVPIETNSKLIGDGEEFISKYLFDYLRRNLEKFPEDGRRAIVDYLMSEELLAHVAKHIGMKDIVLCAEFPVSNATLAASFKAIVAALLHSSDSQRAEAFVRDLVLTQLQGKHVLELWQQGNALERLNATLEAQGRSPPEPRLCARSAVNTILAVYRVGLYNKEKQLLGIGWGESIEVATDVAARDALARMYHTTLSMAPLDYAATC